MLGSVKSTTRDHVRPVPSASPFFPVFIFTQLAPQSVVLKIPSLLLPRYIVAVSRGDMSNATTAAVYQLFGSSLAIGGLTSSQRPAFVPPTGHGLTTWGAAPSIPGSRDPAPPSAFVAIAVPSLPPLPPS